MLKKSIRSLKDKYIVNIVAAFFWNGDYKFVLKHFTGPFSTQRPYAVYATVFRILSLKNLEDDEWKSDYGYLLSKNLLDVFEKDDREYIRVFLLKYLSGSIDLDPRPEINLDHVSKTTKKYFPLEKNGKEFIDFFY